MANTTKYPGLKETIVFNETKLDTPDYKSPADLAKQYGCSVGYIYRQRYLLGIANAPEKSPTPTIRLTDAISDTGALKDLLTEPLISPLDRLKVLSRLIRTGAPQVKIAAIKAYEELTRTSEGRIGPGVPLTSEQKAERLARLLMAVGENVATTAWRQLLATKRQLRQLERRYQLPPQSFQSLKRRSKNRCMICRSKPRPRRALAVDHCHVTNQVRGLLCDKCNMALGMFNDDPYLLTKALAYLLANGHSA